MEAWTIWEVHSVTCLILYKRFIDLVLKMNLYNNNNNINIFTHNYIMIIKITDYFVFNLDKTT